MINVAGLVRKSPGKDEKIKDSVNIQKKFIYDRVKNDFDEETADCIKWFVDEGVSGDDPNRLELNKFFEYVDCFSHAYCLNVDRFSRSYLGIEWFMEYFATDNGKSPHSGCKLVLGDVGALYLDDGSINTNNFLHFFMMCGFSMLELMKIRVRTKRGRDALTPEQWADKYRGRRKKK